MTRMKDLALIGAKVHGPGLVHVKGMTQLEELNLASSPVNDAGLAHISGFARLRKLQLSIGVQGQITDAGLAHLPGLKQLESLDLLGQHGVTDAGLVHLKGMTHLRKLEISGTSIKGPGLEHLRDLKSLKNLRLGGMMTDKSMAHVANLPAIEELDMENAQEITETGLDHLVRLSSLRDLTIDYHAVGPRFAEQLQKFPNLKEVTVQGRRLADSQMAELHRLVPKIEVHRQDLATGALIRIFTLYEAYKAITSPR